MENSIKHNKPKNCNWNTELHNPKLQKLYIYPNSKTEKD
jgi:hypothetical protein